MDRWLGPNEDRSHDVLAGALSLTQYEAPPLVPRGSSLDATGLIVHLCSWSYRSTGLLVVTRAFNIHRHISKGPSFLFGLRFRSNYHSRKHVSSVMHFIDRPGPHMLGAREAPGGILGSLGSPRGYASAYTPPMLWYLVSPKLLSQTAMCSVDEQLANDNPQNLQSTDALIYEYELGKMDRQQRHVKEE